MISLVDGLSENYVPRIYVLAKTDKRSLNKIEELEDKKGKNKKVFIIIYYLLFTQDSLFSTYCTVINEGPAIEVLIIFKAPIWATEFTLLNQTTPRELPSVRIPCRFELTFRKFRLWVATLQIHAATSTLIIFKAPIWATEFTQLYQTKPRNKIK